MAQKLLAEGKNPYEAACEALEVIKGQTASKDGGSADDASKDSCCGALNN